MLESKGKELRKVAGKAAEVGSSRQRMDRAQAGTKGASTFAPGVDGEFRVVFKRADEAMYRDKDAYYREHYDPRRRT